tara:strand:- start:42 stop:662 length:621 start_codon:yes stop_codon:yes gene_type:complete
MEWNELVKNGFKNGLICGLWAVIPGVLIVINANEASTLELLINALGLIVLSPMIVCIMCMIFALRYTESEEIFLASMICGVSGIFTVNFVIQLFYIGEAEINNNTIDIGFSDFINLQLMITGLLISAFSAIVVISNLDVFLGYSHEEEVEGNLPPKPTWDPRIEQLKQQLIIVNKEIEQLKNPTSQLSDDGNYQWNGAEWIPVNQQ